MKNALGYDDSLDAFGVHAIGGIIGALLTGVFCAPSLGGSGFSDGVTSIGTQVGIQFIGVLATLVYTAVMSLIILKILDAVMGLRVSEEAGNRGAGHRPARRARLQPVVGNAPQQRRAPQGARFFCVDGRPVITARRHSGVAGRWLRHLPGCGPSEIRRPPRYGDP